MAGISKYERLHHQNLGVMLRTCLPSVGSRVERDAREIQERLPPRIALLAVFGLSLIAWAPLLVPAILILCH
jgi:hypothetical protein